MADDGIAMFVDMFVTNSGISNVAVHASVTMPDVLLGVYQEHDHADHYHLVDQLVPSALVTDGVRTGLAYAVYDQNPVKRQIAFPVVPMPVRGRCCPSLYIHAGD